ncbi:MAG TPA: FG-GAP-like repeat-containing protein, partial [Verrucomicrobiae bacterium]|nr:FG-GAP-like repeat-containing protein [Verrucomicrobiae bacterium]
ALGNGDGSFGPRTNFAAAGGPYGVAVADFNADGKLDLAVANQSADNVSVLLGNGNGSFGAATNFGVGNTPRSVAVGDLNGDGKPDVAVVSASDNQVSVLIGVGNGAFFPATNHPSGGSGSFHVVMADADADGNLDVVVAGYGNNVVGVLRGNGNGTLKPVVTFPIGGNPISVAAGDYNGDGRPDIATANHASHNVGLLLGNNTEPLVEDPLASGIRTGTGRGNLNTSSDVDYWSFTGAAGDLFSLAVDIPGNPASSALYFRIYRPDGGVLTEFGANFDGWGQSVPATLPLDGTYVVQVSANYDYLDEYRLRVTTARPPTQMETETNNNTSQADVPSLVLTNGHQVARILGYISAGDGPGDYYLLGNLAEGTTITLGSSQPASSGIAAILGIYDSGGVVVTNSAVRAANLTFTVPAGAGGSYYARVISDDFGVAQQFGGTNGFALRLDGANDYIGATDSASLRPTSLTLEGWFNFSAVGGTRVMMGKTLVGGVNDSYVLWHDAGLLRAGIGDNGGLTELNVAWTPQPGAWYHLAYTFDNASDLHVLYINGVQQASGVVTRSPVFDTHPLLIGADINNEAVSAFFGGKADEVRVWNVPRSGAQIAASMSQSLVGNEGGLMGYWRLDEGSGSVASDATANGNNGTLFNNPVWAPSGLNNVQPAGLLSQYILNIDLADTLPPVITSNNLPPEGSTNAIIVDRFTLGFSEDMSATSVTNPANYDLRAAGPDTLFDTGDDEVYTVTSTGYATGLTGSYVVDGPLQPGRYRFTARTTLQDRSGNGLASPHLRQFVLLGVSGFIFESRNNNTQNAATSLSLSPTNASDGSFTTGGSFPVGANPYFVLAGLVNADAHLDLITANNGSDNVSVLLGNGDGTFQPATNFA